MNDDSGGIHPIVRETDIEENANIVEDISYLRPCRKLHRGEVWISQILFSDSSFFPMNESSNLSRFDGSDASKPLPVKRCIESFYEYKVPLDYFGIPPIMVEYYKKKGIDSLYEWQSRCLLTDGVLEGRNLTYAAPTSGGKTLVAELLMCRRLFHNPQQNRAIIVLPYISLVIEKYQQLKSCLRGLLVFGEKIKIACYYGNKGGNHRREHIVICTIEKANSILNHIIRSKKLSKFRTWVIDEVHMIGDSKRGYLIELLLTKLMFLQNTSHIDLQIISLSATLPNIGDIVSYTHSIQYVATNRPNSLTEYIIADSHVYDNSGRRIASYSAFQSVDAIPPELSDRLSPRIVLLDLATRCANRGKQIIVFLPTRRDCTRLTRDLCSYAESIAVAPYTILTDTETTRAKRQALCDALCEADVSIDKSLLVAVLHGICYHHAGLAVTSRQLLEDAIRAGTLRVTVATTTLAVGVDFPVDVVIVYTVRSGQTELSAGEYRQMAGRAGRRGAGEAYVMDSVENIPSVVRLMTEKLPAVRSALRRGDRGLARPLLEAICLCLVTTLQSLQIYIHSTFLCRQCTSIELRNNVCESLGYLQEHDIIQCHMFNNTILLKATRLGKAIGASSLPLEESILIYRDLFNYRCHVPLDTDLLLVFFITPTFMVPTVRWNRYLSMLASLTPQDRAVARLLEIDDGYITYCMQYRLKTYTPQPYHDASHEDQLAITHRRFYGALLLQELGGAGGQNAAIQRVMTKYGVDRGELQRFWEAAELYLQLVSSMCVALNWTVLTRLLASLKGWFRSRIPRSFNCFLQDTHIPVQCLQWLAEEDITVRDVAEMGCDKLTRRLQQAMAVRLGVTCIDDLMKSCDGNENVVVQRRRDYEFFLSDMRRIATEMVDKAMNQRKTLHINNEKIEEDKSGNISVLISPLVREEQLLLNSMENEESDDGIRSTGVLSASDEFSSQSASDSDEEQEKKRTRVVKEEFSVMADEQIKIMKLSKDIVTVVNTFKGNELTYQPLQSFSSGGIQVGNNSQFKAV